MRKCKLDYIRIGMLLVIALLATAQPLRAQVTSTWSGLGNNNLWSNGTNWQGNVPPPSSALTAVIFTGTTQNTVVQNVGGFTLNSLTFASEAGPFTINQSTTDFFTFQPTTGALAPPHIDLFSSNPQAINFPSTGFQLAANLLINGTGGGSLTLSGQVVGIAGSPRLILNAPSTLTLTTSVANTMSGIDLNNGTLRVSSDIAFGNGSLSFGGGSLQLTNNLNLTRPIVVSTTGTIDANGFTANMLSTALTVTGAGRLTFTNSNGTGGANISAQLQQSGGLTVTGANNTVSLNGTNTYSGGTTIANGATLVIDTDARLGNPASTTVLDGGTLRLSGAGGYNTPRAITLNPSGGTIDINAGTNPIGLFGVISGSGGLTKTGTGAIRLLAANTYTGLTTINAGTLDIGHNQAAQNSTVLVSGGALSFTSPANSPTLGGLAGTASITFSNTTGLTVGGNNASTTWSGNFAGLFQGAGLTKTGSGTWTLAGSNTFTGPFNIQNGTVVAGSANALSQNAPINLSSLATLDLNGFTFAPLSGTSTFAGPVQMRFGALVASLGVTMSYNGATLSNGFLSGTGQHVLNGNNTFNNVTTFNGTHLIQSGTLNLNNSTIGGSLSAGGTVNWNNGTLSSSGNLTLSNAANFTAVTSNGRLNVSGGVNPGTLTINASALVLGGGSTTFVGSTSEPGGTINLNGQVLDLHGALLVNNGTISNGTTIVGFGSLAKGAGTYGPVNVTDGGKFSPGNSPGSVTTGPATWNSGGSYLVELADALAGAGIGWDTWNIDGTLSLNSTNTTSGRFTIALSTMDALAANFDPHRDYDWVILHASGGISSFDPGVIAWNAAGFENDLAGGRFGIISDQNNISVHFSAVPEPTLAAGLLASICLLRLRCQTGRSRQ